MNYTLKKLHNVKLIKIVGQNSIFILNAVPAQKRTKYFFILIYYSITIRYFSLLVVYFYTIKIYFNTYIIFLKGNIYQHVFIDLYIKKYF